MQGYCQDQAYGLTVTVPIGAGVPKGKILHEIFL